IEVLRIGMAVALLACWHRMTVPSYQALLDRYPEDAYRPLGLLRLLGGDPPPVWCLEGMKWLALVGAVLVAVGLLTRPSLVVTTVSMCLLVGFREAFGKSWHHSFTPVLVAALAFMFAPAGRRLAIDALLRRRLGRPPLPDPPAWPVLLVQVAAALLFFNAVYWKFLRAGFHWALSDSLRHHILAQFDWAGHARTPLADFLVHHELAWKAAAAANMVTQAVPIAACFLVRRPLLRALCGVFFVLETVLLDLVMDLPNYQLLPLAVVFVDWDRFLPWLGRRLRPGAAPEPPPPPEMSPRARRLAGGFIGLFLLANLVVAFSPRGLDIWLNLYPLSQYPMFSQARAKQPYDLHQSWEYETIRFSIDHMAPGARRARIERALDTRFRRRWSARDPALVERLLREARTAYRLRSRTVTASYAILVAPPYPAEPELAAHHVGVLGRLEKETFRSLLGSAGVDPGGRPYLEPRPTGMTLPPGAPVSCILGNDPVIRPLAVQAEGKRLYYRPLGPELHTCMAEVAGERFVIATTRPQPASED
ncbi:MAG TPA: hypothetical protein VFU21_31470, partial [Kofleriaceae bacterium]|nr:hypothetical protein [Kofleriaceae bacterium]